MMISAAELRRYLLVLFMLGGVLLCYLFWNQPTTPDLIMPTYANPEQKYVHITKSSRKLDTRWTWECQTDICVRKEAKETEPHTSLQSCNMLCRSTQLWPEPTGQVTLGSSSILFNHPQLEFETTAAEPAAANIRFTFTLFNETVQNMIQKPNNADQKSDIKRFVVRVSVIDSAEVQLSLKTNESYTLVVRPRDDELIASVRAENFFGARHGLETLSQLIWWDEFAAGGMLRVVNGASIQDAPKFQYRGLMVDTARNFMPIENLKRVIVGMAANKLNVFHWHVSDSQSFPMELPSVPQLARYGAYAPHLVYTVEQTKDLVEYANLRGIRVLMEVDMPAHAGNGWTWGPEEGLGELAVCVNMQPWALYCGEPPCGQLNPDNPNVYDVLEKIFRDLIELSGETEIFHIGGDEVNLECWQQHRNRNGSNAYVDLHEVWGNFTLEALKRLQKANGNRKPQNVVVWSSNLAKRPYSNKYLDKSNVVVQSWGGSSWAETPELIGNGYKIIVSHVDAWYLDCGFGKWRERGTGACDPYRNWQTVYAHQPWYGSKQYRDQVVGGEACLWGEQVDHRSLDTRLWPRAAAFAERVWSDPNPVSPVDPSVISEGVYTRLSTHRDRLIGRGLSAEALWPRWCTQNPAMCL